MRSTARGACARTAATLAMTLAFAVAWLGLESASRADGAILFVGKIEPRDRAVIKSAIEDTAKQLGWSFTERVFPTNERDDILACLQLDRPTTCIDHILQATNIDKLSVVQVGRDTRSPDVIVTQQVVAPGASAVFIQRRTCEQCDADTLRQHVTAMTKKLLEDAASGSSKTTLSIKSSPPGAWITLDGDSAGATNSTMATFPGKHTVMLRATGYETEVRDVTAVDGKTTDLVVTLRLTKPLARAHDPIDPDSSRVLPWLVIGAGAAAVLTGGILLAIDQDPDPSPNGSFEIRDTAAVGVGVLVAGAAVVGIGGYLLVRSTRPKSSRPTAALSAGAVSVGWEMRF